MMIPGGAMHRVESGAMRTFVVGRLIHRNDFVRTTEG